MEIALFLLGGMIFFVLACLFGEPLEILLHEKIFPSHRRLASVLLGCALLVLAVVSFGGPMLAVYLAVSFSPLTPPPH